MNFFSDNISNLVAFKKISKDLGFNYWIFGKPLLYAYNLSRLLNNCDDEVVINLEFSNSNLKSLIEVLNSNDFLLKYKKKNELMLIRNQRLLNVKFLINNGPTSYVDGCLYKSEHFKSEAKIRIIGEYINIPLQAAEILEEIFVPSTSNKLRKFFYNPLTFKAEIKKLLIQTIAKYSPLMYLILLRCNYFYKNRTLSKDYFIKKKLTYEEFINLDIDCSEFNWQLRKSHMDIISCNGKYKKIKDIVNYLKDDENLKKLSKNILDTKTNTRFNEPIYYSKKFWKNGNNFFINPIIYGFRKDVCQYEKINTCTRDSNISIYSKEYYSSLTKMNNIEIKKMLKKYPLEVVDGELSSGRHRACAMIGRLIRNEKYLPIHVMILPKNS